MCEKKPFLDAVVIVCDAIVLWAKRHADEARKVAEKTDDPVRKAELLRLLCQFEEINIAQSVAVGDGANDLPMLNLAGLGIAFHAKPKVKATARQSISTIGLDGILYFLGLKDSRIEQ